MNLLTDLVKSCAFVHDDFAEPGLQLKSDWDLYGTKPFLLGADVCVARGLQCFGESYLQYLDGLKCIPSTIITPVDYSKPLIIALLQDPIACSNLRKSVQNKQLHLSPYYSNSTTDHLLSRLASPEFVPLAHPGSSVFAKANNKIEMRCLLEKEGIPIPYGVVCSSAEELGQFYNSVKHKYSRILLKKDHWRSLIISTSEEIENLSEFEFPLTAEIVYPVRCSPVSHNVMWHNQFQHLFILEQSIHQFHYSGNRLPTDISDRTKERISEFSRAVLEKLPNYSGICGIDFIITQSDELLVVDVNPRFNSSTYPFYFLVRMAMKLEEIHADYSYTRCNLANLDKIFLDSEFLPFSRETGEGIFIFAPVLDPQKGIIVQLSYLCVGKTEKRLRVLREKFSRLISQKSEVFLAAERHGYQFIR